MRCQQCGGLLKGYYQFSVCSECYTKNNRAAHKQYLASKESKNEYEFMLLHKSKTPPTY